MSSSPTSSTSSTRSRISGSVSAPGDLTAMPSAMVAWPHSRGLAVQRAPHRRKALGLHAEDLDARAQRTRRGGHAADQPAAAHRHHQRVDVPAARPASPARSCPARPSRRGRRRGAPASGRARCASCRPCSRASSKVSPAEHHLGAEAARVLHLHRRREARHDDGRRHAHALRVVGHALRMVAGRHRQHAARALVGASAAPSC